MTLKKKQILAGALVFAGAVFSLPPFVQLTSVAAASSYTLQPVEFGVQLKTPDGRVVFEYLSKKPNNIGLTSASAACFHPVNTPSGERVTSIAPNDHPHHRGIFFGWQDSEFHEPSTSASSGPTSPLRAMTVSRADFWGWGSYAPRDGRVVENRSVKLVSADEKEANVEIQSDWKVGKRKMLDETENVVVSERDGVYVLDFDYRFTPVADYVLNRSAFGGFDVQCRKDGDSYFSTAAGKVELRDPHYAYPELNWPSEPWYDYTIRIKDSGKTVGTAVVDHPDNPPTSWHNSRSLWMLNPTICALVPVTIPKDTALRLRYRVIMHDGGPPTPLLQKLSTEFRATR